MRLERVPARVAPLLTSAIIPDLPIRGDRIGDTSIGRVSRFCIRKPPSDTGRPKWEVSS
ncbi:hypothetical protein HMPREF0291_12013 [Corynebacterium genitalium ATCC 33030]|uniref:Uncharacterized protein n=1 Tax=Corynebacterium genitalium ATCC 33030 TaxID=585529 RepID=D7WDX5_9CORY|nr:hypothetical protein HMPREF0291_12013 [Corynebacterium genitalium ATCC 33030]